MKLHTKGPKVGRDRLTCVLKYRQLTDYFWWKKSASDNELAGMSPNAIYSLAEMFYNRLTLKQKKRYAGHIGLKRDNPTSFHWFFHDLCQYSKRPWLWLLVSAPFRYPRFLKRIESRKAVESHANEVAGRG